MPTYKLTHWQRPAWSLLAPYTVQRGLSAEAAATLRAAYEARGDRVRVEEEDPADLARWLESARGSLDPLLDPLPLAWRGRGLGYEWGAAWSEGWPREGRGGKVGL